MDAKATDGSTALSLAIANSHPDVEKLLRKHGAQ
jgi:ankyrin repeat protein